MNINAKQKYFNVIYVQDMIHDSSSIYKKFEMNNVRNFDTIESRTCT